MEEVLVNGGLLCNIVNRVQKKHI